MLRFLSCRDLKAMRVLRVFRVLLVRQDLLDLRVLQVQIPQSLDLLVHRGLLVHKV
jgi:hypothetical protein